MCVCVSELDLLPFLYSLFSISVAPVPSPRVFSAVAQRLSCRSSPVSTSRRGLCSLCLRSSPPVGSPLPSFAPLPSPRLSLFPSITSWVMTRGTGGDQTISTTSLCVCACVSFAHTHTHTQMADRGPCLPGCLSGDGVLLLLSALSHT